MAPSRFAAAAFVTISVLLLAAPFWPPVVWAVLALDGFVVSAMAWDSRVLRAFDLRIVRILPDRFERGEESSYAIEIENRSRFPVELSGAEASSPELRIEEPRFSAALEPAETRRIELRALPGRRGERLVGPARIRLSRPLGLAERRLTLSPQPIVVSPSLAAARRSRMQLRASRAAGSGVHRLRLLGSGHEFDRLRDFATGDDVRHIDWNATARRRFPVTRLFRAEREQNILIAIDTGRLMGRLEGDRTRLDIAVEAALALLFAAEENGDRVGLYLFDEESRLYEPPSRGKAHLRRLTDALSKVEARRAAADPRVLSDAVRVRCRSRALVVVLTDAVDEEEGRRLVEALPTLSPPHVPVAVFFREEALEAAARSSAATDEDAFAALSARVLLEERRLTIARLRQRGVQAVESAGGELAASLLSRYLEAKNRQIL